jgi:hypothetical protein
MRRCIASLLQSVGARAGASRWVRAVSLISFAIFLHHAQRDDVEGEGNEEQHEAEREAASVLGLSNS